MAYNERAAAQESIIQERELAKHDRELASKERERSYRQIILAGCLILLALFVLIYIMLKTLSDRMLLHV